MQSQTVDRSVAVPEDFYGCDLVLHDRFLAFSAEILKLSVAGIGAIGFFIALLADNRSGPLQDAMAAQAFQYALEAAVGLFALAAGLSMAHRFYSSDGMWHHLRLIRSRLAGSDDGVEKDKQKRRAKLKRSETCLKASAVALVAGSVSLGVAFIEILPVL